MDRELLIFPCKIPNIDDSAFAAGLYARKLHIIRRMKKIPDIRKCLRHLNSPSPSFMRGIRACFLRHFIP